MVGFKVAMGAAPSVGTACFLKMDIFRFTAPSRVGAGMWAGA